MEELDFDDSEFDPEAEAAFVEELLDDPLDFLPEDDYMPEEHLSLEELQEIEQREAQEYYRQMGVEWDEV